MKLIVILITNNTTAYGRAQPLRQAVLFVFVPVDNYTYDGVGRLASETKNGATTNYSYNSANNITQAGNKTFLYDNQGRLVEVGSDTFSYDAMGNPTTYKGNTFVWEQGRKLVSGTLNNKDFEYAYDGNGMRYEKIVDGVKTNYYYNGNQLLMESKNSKRIWYVYGVTGIEGMIVEGGFEDITYYFDKNVLGDIIAIRDEFGNVVATYEYDAWGNCTVMNENGYVNTSASFIGNVNPFRYRGYYYDVETGFYYLQTRYYDPTICRFINADNYELVAQLSYVPGELNMYAYCNNNPIMYTDETGEAFFLASFVIGLIVGAGFGALTALAEGENVVAGAIIGGLSGGIIGGFGGGFLLTFGVNSFANMTQDFINYGSIDFENSLGSGLIAGGLSFINTQAIGLISNKLGAKFADEIFSSFGEILFERIAADLSRNIARRRNNPFGFSIGISQFY